MKERITLSGILKEAVIFLIIFLTAFFIMKAVNTRFIFNVVDSGSMLPTLKVGTLTMTDTKAYDYSERKPERGDIIIYKLTDQNGNVLREVAHRVVGTNDDGTYETKGDNNGDPDGWEIKPENIVGKVIFHTNLFSLLYR